MIDVHIVHMPGERSDWWEECERSLAGHPITIHHISGVAGDVRQARYNGFRSGVHDLVSFVDPDDRVLPGAFAALHSAMVANPRCVGAYGLSNIITEDGDVAGLTHPFREYSCKYLSYNYTEIHQPVVMKRDAILRTMVDNWDVIPKVGYAEIVCYALMAREYEWIAVNHLGYEWRKRVSGAHTRVVHRDHVKKQLAAIYNDVVNSRANK